MEDLQTDSEPTYAIISFSTSKLPENYQAMVYAKWMRTLRQGNPLFKRIDHKEFYKNYRKFIDNLLAKPDSKVRLAVLSDNRDCVLGFSIHREDVLDYIFVSKDYRNLGIGNLLVPPGTTTFSHLTLLAIQIWQKKYPDWKFNPFA